MNNTNLLVLLIIVSLGYSSLLPNAFSEVPPSFSKQWGEEGLQKTGLFSFPQGLALDSSGNVYVTDLGNRRVQKFDTNGNFLQTWGIKGSSDGQFQVPSGIAIGNDNVFVIDNDLNRVQKFDTTGQYLTNWGTKGSGNGQFLLPQGIATDQHGDVYVIDTGNSRVQKFSNDGKFLASWGTSGNGNGNFLNPRGIATDDKDNVYVSDSGNNRVQKFTTDGIFIKNFDVKSGVSLRFPQGLYVDSTGNIFIADTGNNRIVKIDRDGNSLSSWGTQGKSSGSFNNPNDVVVDSSGDVFVVDSSNNRIQKFSNNPTITNQISSNPSTVTNAKTSGIISSSNDKINPLITAPSNITVEANGLFSTINIGQATATDKGGIISIESNAPDKFPLGKTVVTWTATDSSGNTAKASQTVTVVDTTSPVIAAPPSTIIEATNIDGSEVDLGEPATSDAVGVVSVTNDAPSLFKIRDTIVTWTATDNAGNSASSKQVVTVQDTTKPKITAPDDVTVEASSSENNLVLGDPIVTDNGKIQTVTNDGPTAFPIGKTIVTWMAIDESGNIGTDVQTVKVIDSTPPVIVPPPDLIVEAISPTENPVLLVLANATDVQLETITNDAPSMFPLGNTIVTWNATDTSGNWAVATQSVSIVDTTPPNLIPPDDVVLEATDPLHNVVSLAKPTAQDIIGISSVTNNAPVDYGFGKNIVTWTAIDTSGNSVSANQTINIIDSTPPEITAPKDIVVEATDPKSNSINLGEPKSFDIVGVESISNDAPKSFPIGMTTVTWSATDSSGNVSIATQTVLVQDTTKPIIIVPTDVTIEAIGPNGNKVSIGSANATDVTGISSIKNNAPINFPIGETIVTWTATDNYNNTSSATQKISLVDSTPPTIVPPKDVTFEAVSKTSNSVSIGVATSTDKIDPNPAISNDAPAVFPLGETLVTWTATDGAGNQASVTQKVSVIDTTNPSITSPPDIEIEATSSTENKIDLGEANATDVSGIKSISNDANGTFPLGETLVTWTAEDMIGHKSSTTQKVTVKDTTPPVITAPSSITVEASNESSNVVNIGQAKANDLVGIQSITNDAPDVFPLGLTTVTWTVTDTSGLSSSDSQKINVIDTKPPELTVPTDVTFEATSYDQNHVVLGKPTATDFIHLSSIKNDAPSSFPLGNTTVTWTATDESGNIATGTQKVTVKDTTPPTLTLPTDVTFEATSKNGNKVEIGFPSAQDNVGDVKVSNDSPQTFPVGKTVVNWTATDASSNTVTAAQTINVIDSTKPSIIPPDDIIMEATDPHHNFVTLQNATATDVVQVASISNDAPESFEFGKTTMTWTAVDSSGNSATAKQIVTIVDTTKPKISPPKDVQTEANSLSNNVVSLGEAIAKDIMGIASITNDAPEVFPFGETVVTWTATDPSGNSSTASQKIKLVDTSAPALTVPKDIVKDASAFETPIKIGNATAIDSIDSNPKISNDAPASFPLGKTIVTWTTTDQFGNSANQTQTVEITACGKPSSSYNLILGGQDEDVLVGTNLSDLIFGLSGNDIINGGEGDDCIFGGEGDDILFGNNGDDTIYGDNGSDVIRGGSGEDKLFGNSGFDIIDGGDDHDSCDLGQNSTDEVVTKCESGKL